MVSHRRWMSAARAVCAAVFFLIALRSRVSFAAQDACFAQIQAKLPSPRAVFSVERDARTNKPVYTFLEQTGCETGACDHVFVTHDKGALPLGGISKVTPGVPSAHKDGACGGNETHSVTYSKVPAPGAGSCEEKVGQLSTSADVVVLVAEGGAYARLVKGAACGNAGCSVRYVTTDATAALLSTLVNTLPDACDGKARYVDVRPAAAPAPGKRAATSSIERQAKVLESYRNGAASTSLKTEAWFPSPEAGPAATVSPAAAAAGEVLQILGQIVVDRASEAAYLRARDEIVRLLGCEKRAADDKGEKKDEAPKLGDKVTLPRTCRVVQTVRLQDLAMSRWALLQALVQDVVMAVLPRVTGDGAAPEKLVRSLTLVAKDLLSDLPRIGVGGSSAAPGTLLWRHAQEGLLHAGEAIRDCQDEPCKVVALAAVALAACHVAVLDEELSDRSAALRGCLVEDTVDRLAGSPGENSVEVIEAAKRIAAGWLGAETAVTAEGAPDHRARARFAVNATFEVGCLWLYSKNLPASKCPAQLEPEETLGDRRHVASLVRFLVVSAIDGDTNAVIAGLSMSVDVALDAVNGGALSKEERRALSRGLRLCGAILQYAETFSKPGAREDAQALHERRTKILESLTREMTNREGREDDHIFSLGGSLRAVAGARFDPNGERPTFFGPLSLPLGIGFQSSQGFHLEIGLFDLGQYLSYQESPTGLKVREPEPADALSPSLTVGWSWGKSFPFFVGLTAGYAPQYDFTTAATRSLGSINLGVTTGVYVPLFDLN